MKNKVNNANNLNKKKVVWWNVTPELRGGNRLYDIISEYSYYSDLFNPDWKNDPGPGGVGYLDFNGINSYGNMGDYPAIRITNSLTISVWVKSSTINNGIVLSRGTNTGASTSAYWLRFTNSGSRASFGVSDGTWQYEISNSSNINDGQWHRWTGVYNSNSATITLYIDGQSVASGIAAPSINGTSQSLYMAGNGTTFTACSLDNIAIWSRNLSAAEVNSEYNEANIGSLESFKIPPKKKFSNIILFHAAMICNSNSNAQIGIGML